MAEPPSAMTLLVEMVAPEAVMEPAVPVVTPVGAVEGAELETVISSKATASRLPD